MKNHAPTNAATASCACVEPTAVRRNGRPPAIQRCPAPLPAPKCDSATIPAAPPENDAGLSRSRVQPVRRADGSGDARQIYSSSLLRTLCVQLPTLTMAKKHVLFRQDEPADAVFYIASGVIHRVVTTENGSERLVAILGHDDFCGEECLTAEPSHATAAVVVEEARIIRIDKAIMLRLLHQSPEFSDLFTAFLLSRKLKTEAALISQLVGSVEQRLRRALLTLAGTDHGQQVPGPVVKARQEMLAAMVGTTRPRVNHLLNKLRKLGLIDYGGDVPAGEIHLRAALGSADRRGV